MKFLTFKSHSSEKPLPGLLDPSHSRILDLSPLAPSLLELIENFEWVRGGLERLIQTPASCFSVEEIEILAPLPRPTSVRDGYAFRQHVEASRKNRGLPMIPEFDEFPIFYYTNALCTTGPGPIRVHRQALEKLDFELEVAVVIGKGGQDIPASQADDHIFGYTIMNDWSARALQMKEMKMNLGPAKGKDFATSYGPYLVTRDELRERRIHSSSAEGERYNLKMSAFVNQKQLSLSNLKEMRWTFAQIIERASQGTRLYPGEIIGSGTAGTGCLMELNGSGVTQDLWLKPGDHVALEVEGLGRLENSILAL